MLQGGDRPMQNAKSYWILQVTPHPRQLDPTLVDHEMAYPVEDEQIEPGDVVYLYDRSTKAMYGWGEVNVRPMKSHNSSVGREQLYVHFLARTLLKEPETIADESIRLRVETIKTKTNDPYAEWRAIRLTADEIRDLNMEFRGKGRKAPDDLLAGSSENSPTKVLKFDFRQADADYKSFPPFAEWLDVRVDHVRWERYTTTLKERGAVPQDEIKRALDVVKRAAAVDTGAIEGLYDVGWGIYIRGRDGSRHVGHSAR
jgi:hypothetical protein